MSPEMRAIGRLVDAIGKYDAVLANELGCAVSETPAFTVSKEAREKNLLCNANFATRAQQHSSTTLGRELESR